MRIASVIMYRIANIFLWLAVIVCITGIVVGSLVMANVIKPTDGSIPGGGLALIITSSVMLLIEIIVLSISRSAAANARDGNHRAAPHVVMLILGILSANVFFFLGALFGLVSVR